MASKSTLNKSIASFDCDCFVSVQVAAEVQTGAHLGTASPERVAYSLVSHSPRHLFILPSNLQISPSKTIFSTSCSCTLFIHLCAIVGMAIAPAPTISLEEHVFSHLALPLRLPSRQAKRTTGGSERFARTRLQLSSTKPARNQFGVLLHTHYESWVSFGCKSEHYRSPFHYGHADDDTRGQRHPSFPPLLRKCVREDVHWCMDRRSLGEDAIFGWFFVWQCKGI